MAKIRITQNEGKQHIEQPQATLQIRQVPSELNIHTIPPKLDINQSKAWEDMNLLSIARRIATHGEAGLQAASEGAARRASEGRELMEIENEGSPIIEQAVRHAQRPQKQLGIDFIPSPFSVQIAYHPGEVTIQSTQHEPRIDAHVNKPIHHYERGDVTIEMDQHANLEIDVVNRSI